MKESSGYMKKVAKYMQRKVGSIFLGFERVPEELRAAAMQALNTQRKLPSIGLSHAPPSPLETWNLLGPAGECSLEFPSPMPRLPVGFFSAAN